MLVNFAAHNSLSAQTLPSQDGFTLMTNKKINTPENITFEATLQSLESLVEKLENPRTTLDQSLKAFELGIDLTRKAQKSLAEAEQKVHMLSENGNQPFVESDFDVE